MLEDGCVVVKLDKNVEEPVGVVITDILTGDGVANGVVELGTDCASISYAGIASGLYSVDIRVSDNVVDSAKIQINK